MKTRNSPHHWLVALLVAAAFLLTLSEAHGQVGSAAAFQGRPALAGAQGGLGAQAGPPQGGLGVQGNQAAALYSIPLRQSPDAKEQAPPDLDATTRKDPDIKPGRDPGLAKDQRSASKKAKRIARNIASRSRHGVSPVDSTTRADADEAVIGPARP